MSVLAYAAKYKNKVINLLLKNKDFIKLINPTPSESDELDIIDVLIGGDWVFDGQAYSEQGHIFDHNFVDETVTQDKTFIFVEAVTDTIRDDMFVDFTLYICVFTSKSLVKLNDFTAPTREDIENMGYVVNTRYANRIDTLCDIIENVVSGSDKFESLGNVKPAPRGHEAEYSPNKKYYGKCLKYVITNYKESGGGGCGY